MTDINRRDTSEISELSRAVFENPQVFVDRAESRFRDQLRGMHLTGRRAGELAAGGSAGRLVLTHIQPWTDPEVPVGEAREVFDGLVEAATSGATWAF